jgi:hypothetical protein
MSAIWSVSDALAGYQQQDAHEFFIALLDNLHVHLMLYDENQRRLQRLESALETLQERQRQRQKVVSRGTSKPKAKRPSFSHAAAPSKTGEAVPSKAAAEDAPSTPQKIAADGTSLAPPACAASAASASAPPSASGSPADKGAAADLVLPHPLRIGDMCFTPRSTKLHGERIKSSDAANGRSMRALNLTGFVSQVFAGVTKSNLVCQGCKHVSCTYERFLEVSLGMCHDDESPAAAAAVKGETEGDDGGASSSAMAGQPHVQQGVLKDLEACLRKYTAVERLGTGMKCDSCGNDDMTKTKQLSFSSLPLVLTLQLKRFDAVHDTKIADILSFPIRGLDMGSYLSGWMGADTAAPRVLYDLYAVVCHMGSLGMGHYIAYIKDMGGGWVRCDDTMVQWVSEEEVISCEAYMLFYSQRGQVTAWSTLLAAQS